MPVFSSIKKDCLQCGKTILVQPHRLQRTRFCSKKCFYLGRELKGLFKKGHPDLVPKESRGHSEETKRRISLGGKGKHSGEKAWNWIVDRSKVKKSVPHDSERKRWTRAIKNRDGWRCKISDGNCSGKLEAHHILSWSKFPELRYELNNGITLCHFHHPRKRADEIKLSPYFQSLVASAG